MFVCNGVLFVFNGFFYLYAMVFLFVCNGVFICVIVFVFVWNGYFYLRAMGFSICVQSGFICVQWLLYFCKMVIFICVQWCFLCATVFLFVWNGYFYLCAMGFCICVQWGWHLGLHSASELGFNGFNLKPQLTFPSNWTALNLVSISTSLLYIQYCNNLIL